MQPETDQTCRFRSSKRAWQTFQYLIRDTSRSKRHDTWPSQPGVQFACQVPFLFLCESRRKTRHEEARANFKSWDTWKILWKILFHSFIPIFFQIVKLQAREIFDEEPWTREWKLRLAKQLYFENDHSIIVTRKRVDSFWFRKCTGRNDRTQYYCSLFSIRGFVTDFTLNANGKRKVSRTSPEFRPEDDPVIWNVDRARRGHDITQRVLLGTKIPASIIRLTLRDSRGLIYDSRDRNESYALHGAERKIPPRFPARLALIFVTNWKGRQGGEYYFVHLRARPRCRIKTSESWPRDRTTRANARVIRE